MPRLGRFFCVIDSGFVVLMLKLRRINLGSAFLRRRLLEPIFDQFRQGITPDKIALTIALGIVLGVFPVLGAATTLCALGAVCLRLNQPIIQLVNYLAYPLQLSLLLVFYRFGESLFGQPHFPMSIGVLIDRFHAGPLTFIRDFGRIALQGVLVWLLIAPVAAGVIFVVLRYALGRVLRSGGAAGTGELD
jgi:uncharacterized protein (DUF2062 family)